MLRFRNVPIIGKISLLIGLFGLFALGAMAFSSSRLSDTNTKYTHLVTHVDQATVDLARATRAAQTIRATIAELAIARTQQDDGRISGQLADAKNTLNKFLDEAAQLDPADASHVEDLRHDTSDLIDSVCGNAIRLAAAATADADVLASQKIYMNECSPKFAALTGRFAEAVSAVSKQSQDAGAVLAADTSRTIVITWAVVLAGLVGMLCLSFVLCRSWLSRPIGDLVAVMGRLARGDYAAVVDGQDQRDEIGVMARAVEVFKGAGLDRQRLSAEAEAARQAAEAERERSAAHQAELARQQAEVVDGLAGGLSSLSEGNLTRTLHTPFAPEYEQLRSDFNAAADKLRSAMTEVATKTGAIDAGANEFATAANDLSRRTEQQAASLEETAAALEQITATVKKTAEGSGAARDAAAAAQAEAAQSNEVVVRTTGAMSEIETSSRQVGRIVGVIDEIAFQTNLLALNAGVEAARAGDAGRGFAVVASEVRTLAQRSAEAAKEIKGLVQASENHVREGVRLVGDTGSALTRIAGHVTTINGLVAEISASCQEQATGLGQVNVAVNQMDQSTQQNAAMVEQSTAAAQSLGQETRELSALVGRFRIGAAGPGASRAALPSPAGAPSSTGLSSRTRALRTSASPARLGSAPPPGRPVAQREPVAAGGDDWNEF